VASRSLPLAVLALLLVAAVAVAAKPVKGGTYAGTLTAAPSETVTFKVSQNGKKVSGLKVSPFEPNTCGAGGPPPPQSSKPAKIRKGKFTATVIYKTTTGKVAARAKVTGTFVKGRREKGVVKTAFTDRSTKSCEAPFKYTTKAG
jgi:hypothetical protein